MSERTRKMRGSRTFGKGKKSSRGGGIHGGKGRAGLHKHKYLYMIKYEPFAYGRHGFKSRNRTEKRVINVGELDAIYRDVENIDLTRDGYAKLLGKGKIERQVTVVVAEFSENAKSKVEAAGGKVVKNG